MTPSLDYGQISKKNFQKNFDKIDLFLYCYKKKIIMKIRIYVEESFTTTVTREEVIIDTENYPELEGMTEDQISDYIDNNIWEMKPTEGDIYESLGEECSDQSIEDEDVKEDETSFYVSKV